MATLLYTEPVNSSKPGLETENKVIKERLAGLGTLLTSMEETTMNKLPNPAFNAVIEEIQKVLDKYKEEGNKV